VASTNNLAVTFPEIAKEWSEKNPKTAYETMPGSHERVFWRCSKCGHEWEARPNDRTGHGSGCPECSKGKAEAKVGELLKTVLNNLSLQALAIGPQYPVQIKGKRKSRFDFALIQDSSVIAFVEYDGRQHFQPVRWAYHISEEQAQEHLEVNQKKDEEKDKYAKDQGIPLIRTHYKEMEEFNKQVKQGIPETETCLYISLKAIICDIIRK
jgi:DNA-directed RNA polymerase subunit RPC12/RpoP/very-short-patch-repair endonuclease